MSSSFRQTVVGSINLGFRQPREELPELSAGTTLLGRYQLVTRRSVGGKAELWDALDTSRTDALVMKVATDRDARFDHDAVELCSLGHPNLAAVVDEGRLPGGRAYCVFELVEGWQLRRLITGPTTLAATGSFVTQVGRALISSHARGSVHGRLSPEHVVVCEGDPVRYPYGQIKVLGLGTTLGAADPSYCAPEQLSGRPIDARADVFALGAIAVEILSGRGPFACNSLRANAVLERRRSGRPPKIELPAAVEHVRPTLVRALAEDPSDRFAGLAELVEALTGERLHSLGRGSDPRLPLHSIPGER